jgi:hypothetical protein
VVSQFADRGLHVLVADTTNSPGRWICQQWSLLSSAVIIVMKSAYLEEIFVFFFQYWIL